MSVRGQEVGGQQLGLNGNIGKLVLYSPKLTSTQQLSSEIKT